NSSLSCTQAQLIVPPHFQSAPIAPGYASRLFAHERRPSAAARPASPPVPETTALPAHAESRPVAAWGAGTQRRHVSDVSLRSQGSPPQDPRPANYLRAPHPVPALT